MNMQSQNEAAAGSRTGPGSTWSPGENNSSGSTWSPAKTLDASRSLPWLLILFAGSGCSALIYEIVWFQMLTLAIGSTAVSLGILLATFMGGLCIGSIFVPRMRAVAEQH